MATLRTALILVSPSLQTRLDAIEHWATVVLPTKPESETLTKDLQRQIESAVDRSADYFENTFGKRAARSVASPGGVVLTQEISGDLVAALDAVAEALDESYRVFEPAELIKSAAAPSDIVALIKPIAVKKWDQALVTSP